MSKELIERLRADAESTDDIGLCADAADRIEELERERDEAVSAVQRLSSGQSFDAVVIADVVKRRTAAIERERDALQADNAELVAALEDNWNCNPCETTRQQKAFDVAQSVLAKVRKP